MKIGRIVSALTTLSTVIFITTACNGTTADTAQEKANDTVAIEHCTQKELTPKTTADSASAAKTDSINRLPVYRMVDKFPEFPGGMEKLDEYLVKNVVYPAESKERNSQGRAYVDFIVETDGSITNTELAKSSCDTLLDREALRVVKSMPKWSPGILDGEQVRTRYTLHIIFSLPQRPLPTNVFRSCLNF